MDNKKNMTDNDCPIYRPFQNNDRITIKKDHYSTSLDPRGYIPVYEYLVNNTPIMWDRETGYVHFTGIWKALGNSKSDIVKMVDSNPELGTKKIRGGFLRIQGTWIPYDFAHILCKRTAWDIRKELIPIFGPQFPLEALAPDHPDYGCLLLDPKNISTNKASQQKRMRTTKRETIKQQHRQQQQRPVRRTKPKPMRSSSGRHSKIASSMSVTRLLNEQSDEEMSDDSGSQESIDSPQSTPSPSFRVIQTFPPEDSLILPPINNEYWSPPPIMDRSLTPVAQDIIDTISATILLQRLSQDDGARPFRPLESSTIPSKVIVGHQEFTICWE